MNRRKFLAALAALPFAPDALKKLAAMKPAPIQYFADFSAEPIIGEWRMLVPTRQLAHAMAKHINDEIVKINVLVSE